MRQWLLGVTSFTCLALSAVSAQSSTLIGDTIECVATLTIGCSDPTAVVGPSYEFTIDGSKVLPYISVDVAESSVQLSSVGPTGITWGNDAFAFTLSDLDFSPFAEITGIANFTTDVSGFDASDISVLADALTINIGLTTWTTTSSASFDILTSSGTPPTTPVPLPAGLPLLLVGIGALGFTGRKRRK